MGFWTPEEVEILENNRSLIETEDMNQIWYSGAFSQKFLEKLQWSFCKLGIDMYKGLKTIPAGFYRWTFTQNTLITSVTLPDNVQVDPYAFRGTLISQVAVPKNTLVYGLTGEVEEIYYESPRGADGRAKIVLHNVKFDHSSLWKVRLEPNYVYTVYQASKNKVRVRGTDGINPVAWVAFPEELRELGRIYKVDELSWNGKNYRAKGNIVRIK
jgi:hypothetical protein